MMRHFTKVTCHDGTVKAKKNLNEKVQSPIRAYLIEVIQNNKDKKVFLDLSRTSYPVPFYKTTKFLSDIIEINMDYLLSSPLQTVAIKAQQSPQRIHKTEITWEDLYGQNSRLTKHKYKLFPMHKSEIKLNI